MKNVSRFFILSAIFIGFTNCGGKNMDETPDGSGSGPNYKHEYSNPNSAGNSEEAVPQQETTKPEAPVAGETNTTSAEKSAPTETQQSH